MNFPLAPAEPDESLVDSGAGPSPAAVENGPNARSFCLQIGVAGTHSELWIPSR